MTPKALSLGVAFCRSRLCTVPWLAMRMFQNERMGCTYNSLKPVGLWGKTCFQLATKDWGCKVTYD